MRVSRSDLLKAVEAVSPGLSSRELIPQGMCLVFVGGKIITFNDEIFCSVPSPTKDAITGAVAAKPLSNLLSRLDEDEIDIEQTTSELVVKGKGRRSGIKMEATVALPVDSIEQPEDWVTVDPSFAEGISVVFNCASNDTSTFALTCVHIHPDFVEACDRHQIARYPVKTGVNKPTLVRAASIGKAVPGGMLEMSLTSSWMHFRNASGLVFSCRRWLEDYPNLDRYLSKEGTSRITLPGGIEEITNKAGIFTEDSSVGNLVLVDIKKEVISIRGDGPHGWYEERRKVEFGGDPIRFLISPKLLVATAKKTSECSVAVGRLVVDTGKYMFTTCTNTPEVEPNA